MDVMSIKTISTGATANALSYILRKSISDTFLFSIYDRLTFPPNEECKKLRRRGECSVTWPDFPVVGKLLQLYREFQISAVSKIPPNNGVWQRYFRSYCQASILIYSVYSFVFCTFLLLL